MTFLRKRYREGDPGTLTYARVDMKISAYQLQSLSYAEEAEPTPGDVLFQQRDIETNAFIHDLDARIALGDTMNSPRFTDSSGRLEKFGA